MSIAIQTVVWTLELPPHLKYVAIALADHAHDDGGEARPSQSYLANKTGLSVRQVRRSLKELVERGVIRVERPSGKGRATCYTFCLGGHQSPVKGKVGRSQTSLGRSSTTVWADVGDPLIIKNHHKKLDSNEIQEDAASDDVRREALSAIRASLRKFPS